MSLRRSRTAATATLDAVRALAVPVTGVVLDDASGLARSDRVPAADVRPAAGGGRSAAQPELSAVQTGLPVAAFNGTLVARFTVPPAASGAGVVRAKTGTLTGVTALAGTVQDREGRVLAFAFLADRIPADAVLTAPRGAGRGGRGARRLRLPLTSLSREIDPSGVRTV